VFFVAVRREERRSAVDGVDATAAGVCFAFDIVFDFAFDLPRAVAVVVVGVALTAEIGIFDFDAVFVAVFVAIFVAVFVAVLPPVVDFARLRDTRKDFGPVAVAVDVVVVDVDFVGAGVSATSTRRFTMRARSVVINPGSDDEGDVFRLAPRRVVCGDVDFAFADGDDDAFLFLPPFALFF
jgi:hypothetical protein